MQPEDSSSHSDEDSSQSLSFLPAEVAQPSILQSASFRPTLRKDIDKFLEVAEREETQGCFGKAEIALKEAMRLTDSFLAMDSFTAKVARRLGLFLNRFLPRSSQAAFYLRKSLKLEQYLNPSSAELTILKLEIAHALVDSEKWEEAALVLEALLEETLPVKIEATALIGRITVQRGNEHRGEEMIREALSATREDSQGYANVLVCLGDALREKEDFEASKKVLEEALSLQVEKGGLSFTRTLRVYTECLKGASKTRKYKPVFKELLKQLEDQRASAYAKAEVLECWGDACEVWVDAALRLLQALEVYQLVEPQSWYVARVLWKLSLLPIIGSLRLYTYPWKVVIKEADKQLAELLVKLPPTSAMMSLGTCDFIDLLQSPTKYAEKLLDLVKFNGGELEVGEALLRLKDKLDFEWLGKDVRSAILLFSSRFPSSKLTHKLLRQSNGSYDFECEQNLLRRLREKKQRKEHPLRIAEIVSKLGTVKISQARSEEGRESRQLLRAARLLEQQALRTYRVEAPGCVGTARHLVNLGYRYDGEGSYEYAYDCFQEATDILQSLNSRFPQVNYLKVCIGEVLEEYGELQEAQQCFDTIAPENLDTSDCVERVYAFYRDTEQEAKALQSWLRILNATRQIGRLSDRQIATIGCITKKFQDERLLKSTLMVCRTIAPPKVFRLALAVEGFRIQRFRFLDMEAFEDGLRNHCYKPARYLQKLYLAEYRLADAEILTVKLSDSVFPHKTLFQNVRSFYS